MSPDSTVEVNAETLKVEVLESDIPVVVDFWHYQFGWCIALNSIFDELLTNMWVRLSLPN